MKTNITIEDLKRTACAKLNPHLFGKNIPHKSGENIPKRKKRSKEKEWILFNLHYWCAQNSFVMEQELRFNEYRKFRFDYAVSSLKLAIEYNGIMSEKSRHTTIKGYSKDMDKLNLAQKDGWTVLQYTPLNYKNLLTDLKQYENGNQS